KRNVRPSTRPLRSLFAPRATRIVRVLLVEPARAWRLEELARAAQVSLGHTHNVVKRLQELAWVEHDESQRIRLGKPADLLESWCESYTYRANEIGSYAAPERVTRAFLSAIARAATAEGRRYAFTLNAGLSLVAPSLRVPAVHCYLEGDPAPVAAALGLRATAEGAGAVHFLAPYDPGVAPSRLCVCLNDLGDLARLETPGADAHAPGRSGELRPHRDEVGKPPSLRQLVRVADRMTHRGTLPADVAPLRHARSSESIRV